MAQQASLGETLCPGISAATWLLRPSSSPPSLLHRDLPDFCLRLTHTFGAKSRLCQCLKSPAPFPQLLPSRHAHCSITCFLQSPPGGGVSQLAECLTKMLEGQPQCYVNCAWQHGKASTHKFRITLSCFEANLAYMNLLKEKERKRPEVDQ